MLIDRSTLDLIAADARDFQAMLTDAGLLQAAAMMLGVLEQLAADRSNLSDDPASDVTNA